jgi:hypothetical protein
MEPRAENEIVRIDLTPSQTLRLRATVGLEVAAIELTVKELEQRIAPKLAANHNESLLDDAPRI